MTWLALFLAVGATARLSLLVTRDAFPPVIAARTWLLRKLIARALPSCLLRARPVEQASDVERALAVDKAREHPLYVLVTCPWCVSFWIGLPAAAAAYWFPAAAWFQVPAAALTASLAAGLTARSAA